MPLFLFLIKHLTTSPESLSWVRRGVGQETERIFRKGKGKSAGEAHRSLTAADSRFDGKRRSASSFERNSPSFGS